MTLRLEIVSRHRQRLGERAVKEFGHNGGSIGRSLESDWVLPDGQRYLSSRHASIDYRSGSYYIIDTSTNGVFVNGADTPVGRGNPQRLFNGDRIRMGEYEMVVTIEGEADETREQLANDKHIDPVELAQRVEPPDPTPAELLKAHEITGVGLEIVLSEDDVEERPAPGELRLVEDPPAPAPRPAPAAARPAPAAAPQATRPQPPAARSQATAARREPASRPQPPAAAARAQPQAPAAAPQPQPAPKPEPAPARPSGRPTDVLDAFFRGAGIARQVVDERQAEHVLHQLGQIMRELIVGVSENLHTRAEQKNTLRVPNTTIQPRGNNPLKFAAGVEEALQNLLFRQSAEYMTPVDAVREAFLDIKLHQQALLAAVRTALTAYVGRLDPDELESKFTSGKRGALINAANKLKYWDVYKDLYQVVTQAPPNQFPPQFIEELAQAYEQEHARAAGNQRSKAKATAG
ncbi:MAG TPA: type VI secretion system-associated FHA domain protein TagH [Gammaproteobacteria bacterium]